jgi:hypothetical protein
MTIKEQLEFEIRVEEYFSRGGQNVQVIDSKESGGHHVVLCRWVRGDYIQFVTWKWNEDSNTFGGNYFSRLVDAATDFERREY